ncbi:MAG: hypothetical protein QMB39_03005 [Bacteroidales bacterium]|jgi:hypothetical protein
MEKLTKQTIKMMLDKYFEGTSTLQEEKALRAYFTSGQFDPEFAEIAPMFEYFADEADHDHKRVVKRQFRINRNTTFRIASVMAAASLVLFTFLMWPQQNENELKLMINGISVNNNELAKSKADDQLEKLNSLMAKVGTNVESLDKLSKVNDAMSSLDKVNNMLSMSSTPNNK